MPRSSRPVFVAVTISARGGFLAMWHPPVPSALAKGVTRVFCPPRDSGISRIHATSVGSGVEMVTPPVGWAQFWALAKVENVIALLVTKVLCFPWPLGKGRRTTVCPTSHGPLMACWNEEAASMLSEIIFVVEPSEDGGYTATALGHAIFTQGDTDAEVERNVRCGAVPL